MLGHLDGRNYLFFSLFWGVEGPPLPPYVKYSLPNYITDSLVLQYGGVAVLGGFNQPEATVYKVYKSVDLGELNQVGTNANRTGRVDTDLASQGCVQCVEPVL